MKDTRRRLHFSLLPDLLAIVRLAPDVSIPAWAASRTFFSVTRTEEELSIVTPASDVPEGLSQQTPWRALKVHGPFDLAEIGVLSAISVPLADAGISIFVISTFDTDYLLVADKQLRATILALENAGHAVEHGKPVVEGIFGENA
jgi:uncharacterized protein